jgi:hypothetical protein
MYLRGIKKRILLYHVPAGRDSSAVHAGNMGEKGEHTPGGYDNQFNLVAWLILLSDVLPGM